MGLILGALAGAGGQAIDIADKQIAQDQALDKERYSSDLAQNRAIALEQAKLAMADTERQRHASDIAAAADPIEKQGIVMRVMDARANNLDGTLPAVAPDGSATAPDAKGFQGDASALYREVSAWPDTNPDKAPILKQLAQQVGLQREKASPLTDADLTDAERQRFAPNAQQHDDAYLQAATKLGYIEPKDVLSAKSRQDVSALHNDVLRAAADIRANATRYGADSRERVADKNFDALHTMTPEMKSTAEGIASGKLPPLTGIAARSPGASMIMAEVLRINPEYNAQNYGAGAKATKDFGTGKEGGMIRSFNVSLAHLDTLSTLADALQNGDTRVLNKIGNEIALQTGKPAPSSFEAAKGIVGDEIVKAIVGSGGALGDREAAQKTIDAANSPAQLKAVIGTYKDLMRGQLDGLRRQYQATTGREDFDQRFLSPQALAVAHPAPAGGASAIPRVTTDDDYNALPAGAQFVAPDGSVRRKP